MDYDQVILDPTDIAILRFLQKDGRMSFTDLSQALNVSVGMIRNRYNRLVEKNILHIIGWADPVKAGLNAYARVILKIRPTQHIRAVADQLMQLDEVSFLALTSGNYDLEINLTCRNNEHLLEVMHSDIHSIEGVFETSTTMYLEIMKWATHDVSLAMSKGNQAKISPETKQQVNHG